MTPTINIDIMPPKRRRKAEDVPQKPLARMAVKLYMLGSLAWDYADTCCDLAAQMRVAEMKPVCRAVRRLKRDYDLFRGPMMDDSSVAKEAELGLQFEGICRGHLSRLNVGLGNEKAMAGLSGECAQLVKAAQMAMTLLDAMELYAAQCDKWLRSHGVDRHSILADHFRRLSILVPQFAGDRYDGHSEARRITARILLNELNQINIYDEKGKM